MSTTAVVVFSGGLDSTVALAIAVAAHGSDHVLALSFDYGQRHRVELVRAEVIAEHHMGVEHQIIDVSAWGHLLTGSALTDGLIDVPAGDYAPETLAATVVPSRNAVFLAMAHGVAVARGAGVVVVGVHAGDHAVYADCRPEFIEAMATALGAPDIAAPLLGMHKADIVRDGAGRGVPFGLTWSCYQGGEVHCGECSTCRERRQAFVLAGVTDPTVYVA